MNSTMTFDDFFSRCCKGSEDRKDEIRFGIWPAAERVYLSFDRFEDEEDFYAFHAAHGLEAILDMDDRLSAVHDLISKKLDLRKEIDAIDREIELDCLVGGITLIP